MLTDMLRTIYIDPEEVAREYLLRCKRRAWKKENMVESLKCFNLERLIAAEDAGDDAPPPLELGEYVSAEKYSNEQQERGLDLTQEDD